MAKYIIKHGQFYEVPNYSLMHHKYVKREKVGDTWKYYYSWDEVKQKPTAKSAFVSGAAKTVGEAVKKASTTKKSPSNTDLDKVADKVIRGDYGNGKERVKKLTAAGYDSAVIQQLVNKKLKSGSKKTSSDTSNEETKTSDTSNKGTKNATTKKSTSNADLDKVVDKVIRGDYGNGKERIEKLSKAGYDSAAVQKLVNKKLKSSSKKTSSKKSTNAKATKYITGNTLREIAKEAANNALYKK